MKNCCRVERPAAHPQFQRDLCARGTVRRSSEPPAPAFPLFCISQLLAATREEAIAVEQPGLRLRHGWPTARAPQVKREPGPPRYPGDQLLVQCCREETRILQLSASTPDDG